MAARILLIENNKKIIKDLTGALVKENYELISAENENSGLKLALSMKPDLILIDLDNQNFDSWQLVGQIKSNEDLRDISIISIDTSGLNKFFIRDVMAKPTEKGRINTAPLIKKIRTVLLRKDNKNGLKKNSLTKS